LGAYREPHQRLADRLVGGFRRVGGPNSARVEIPGTAAEASKIIVRIKSRSRNPEAPDRVATRCGASGIAGRWGWPVRRASATDNCHFDLIPGSNARLRRRDGSFAGIHQSVPKDRSGVNSSTRQKKGQTETCRHSLQTHALVGGDPRVRQCRTPATMGKLHAIFTLTTR